MTEAGLEPIAQRGLLSEEVAARLAQYIATRGLQAGDELASEEELSRLLGVGRRAVREGLRALGSQGIVETRQGRRAIVSDWRPRVFSIYFDLSKIQDEHATQDLYELRFTLEVRAATLAAVRRTDEDLAAMEAAVEAMRTAAAELDAYVDADFRFHSAVVAAARVRYYVWILDALEGTLRDERVRGVKRGLERERASQRTFESHSAILEAIRAGDADAAAAAMNAHLQDSAAYHWDAARPDAS